MPSTTVNGVRTREKCYINLGLLTVSLLVSTVKYGGPFWDRIVSRYFMQYRIHRFPHGRIEPSLKFMNNSYYSVFSLLRKRLYRNTLRQPLHNNNNNFDQRPHHQLVTPDDGKWIRLTLTHCASLGPNEPAPKLQWGRQPPKVAPSAWGICTPI